MNEPSTPLRIDLRLALETVSSGLAFLLAGIAAVDLDEPYNILVPLGVGAVIVMVNRLLGKNAADSVAALRVDISKLITAKTVLEGDATPTTRRKADEAVAAMDAPRPAVATGGDPSATP